MTQIYKYGYTPKPEIDENKVARITAVHRERYEIVCAHGIGFARLKSSIYYGVGENELFPTVGDFALIEYNELGDSIITKTLPRKSFFSRLDPSSSGHRDQAIAANFDYVFILCSLNNDFNIRRIERYIALSWNSGGIPVIILTKSDLVDDYSTQVRQVEKIAAGIGIFVVSAKTGSGLESISEYLKPRKTIVLLGSSGAGKSTLVNTLAGEGIMDVNEIRESDSRGRHTTTLRQLILLKNGVIVMDTPGMRELGMWNASEGLSEAFSDVEDFLGKCKFSDCTHGNEPDCAIRNAITEGKLPLKRWESYMSLKSESRFSENKTKALLDKKKRNKGISKLQKEFKKSDYRKNACTDSFNCAVCKHPIAPQGAGSRHRNHCPNCLSSVHVDDEPGDRASLCGGIMDPIGVWVRKNGEWAIIHRCRSCGEFSSNRIAADDNPTLLMSIAVKPLAAPPFPLGQLENNYSARTINETKRAD